MKPDSVIGTPSQDTLQPQMELVEMVKSCRLAPAGFVRLEELICLVSEDRRATLNLHICDDEKKREYVCV
jgi:hypothetical protein